MTQLGLRIQNTMELGVKIADNSKVSCLRMIQSVKVDALGVSQEIDFYIMSSKGNGYPLILGHPWLIKMQAKQDWEIRELICKQEGKKIVYDMKEKCQQELSHESTTSDSDEDDRSSYTSDEIESTTEEESSIGIMGLDFSQKEIQGSMPIATKLDPPPKEEEEEMASKMISLTLPPKKH